VNGLRPGGTWTLDAKFRGASPSDTPGMSRRLKARGWASARAKKLSRPSGDAVMAALAQRAGFERGLIDADLGGGLIKQRVAQKGQGRSGGYRMIVAYRAQDRAVFLYAFAKNERGNIDQDELVELQKLGSNWLNASSQKVATAIEDGALREVDHDGQKDI
jgi:hypothetical protein